MMSEITEVRSPAVRRPMSAARVKRIVARVVLYAGLVIVAAFFVGPLYILLITSFKPLSEVRAGGLLNLPLDPTPAPWAKAWGEARIGITCGGLKGCFGNSMTTAIPAVFLSVTIGAINGCALAKWPFRGPVSFSRRWWRATSSPIR